MLINKWLNKHGSIGFTIQSGDKLFGIRCSATEGFRWRPNRDPDEDIDCKNPTLFRPSRFRRFTKSSKWNCRDEDALNIVDRVSCMVFAELRDVSICADKIVADWSSSSIYQFLSIHVLFSIKFCREVDSRLIRTVIDSLHTSNPYFSQCSVHKTNNVFMDFVDVKRLLFTNKEVIRAENGADSDSDTEVSYKLYPTNRINNLSMDYLKDVYACISTEYGSAVCYVRRMERSRFLPDSKYLGLRFRISGFSSAFHPSLSELILTEIKTTLDESIKELSEEVKSDSMLVMYLGPNQFKQGLAKMEEISPIFILYNNHRKRTIKSFYTVLSFKRLALCWDNIRKELTHALYNRNNIKELCKLMLSSIKNVNMIIHFIGRVEKVYSYLKNIDADQLIKIIFNDVLSDRPLRLLYDKENRKWLYTDFVVTTDNTGFKEH